MAFAGFPRKVRFTPVPSPLFGPLLEQIDDLAELKCTLRVIWLLHQKRGYPRYVGLTELRSDRALVKGLSGGARDPIAELDRALDLSVRRGTLITGRGEPDSSRGQIYLLNTEGDRKALEGMTAEAGTPSPTSRPETWESVADRPNIFSLYEDNVGMISPMIAEELKEAEAEYPQSWIEDAFREAVTNNKRSWRYVASILERWEREGRSDGGAVGGPKKTGYAEYFRR